jgi:hypothetical protein
MHIIHAKLFIRHAVTLYMCPLILTPDASTGIGKWELSSPIYSNSTVTLLQIKKSNLTLILYSTNILFLIPRQCT